MPRNDDGCTSIIGGAALLIYSIASAFDGKFIPLVVVLIIIAIFWIWRIYEKSKDKRDFQKIIKNEGPYFEKTNSKFPLLVTIIIIGVVGLMVYKKNYSSKISYTHLDDNKSYEGTAADVFADTSIIVDSAVVDTLPKSSYFFEGKQKESDKSLRELYDDLIYFMRLKHNYFSKITSDFEALDNNGLIIINNSSLKILDIRMKYLSGQELSEMDLQFTNLSEGNFVYIQCTNGSCMYNFEDRKNEIGMFQPFETMDDCVRFIELCEKIKDKVIHQ